ncbi:putative membrane protein [Francisella sp. MA067296]|nr:putative membrane protein [Francisella sp. MA067296]
MVIFWLVAGVFIGYAAVYLMSPEYIYNALQSHGFVWISIYGAIKISAFVTIIFAVIFALFDQNKKLLIVPMIVSILVLYFIQHLVCTGILSYLAA